MTPPILIGPSILNADLSDLSNVSRRLMSKGADFLHLDVMDGHFVPNLTFGHPVVKSLRKNLPDTYFDMHMMVSNPRQWYPMMKEAQINQYVFHYEAMPIKQDAKTFLEEIHDDKIKAGISIMPKTDIDEILSICEAADIVLIMTVEPGFGGQKFMEGMMPKVAALRKKFPELYIGVDGGVGPQNIGVCVEHGANMIVSGTAITGSDDPEAVIKSLRQVALSQQLS